jgi:hypothetical protein
MTKSLALSLIGLVVVIGSLWQSSSAEEPAKARKQSRPRRPWLQMHLSAMEEPNIAMLAKKDRAATVYRFLWLPSFHNPISFRFVKTDKEVVLHAARLNGTGGAQPGRILARKTVRLNRAHWERIASHLEKAQFWTLPTIKRPPFGETALDGDTLVVEGVKDGKYHVVIRQQSTGGDFVDLCQAMLFMSGIVDVRNIWFDYRG